MPSGHERDKALRSIRSHVNRKNGDGDYTSVTVAHVEFMNDWDQILQLLPRLKPPKIQNEDGSFDYMPCYDGPALSQQKK